MKRVIIESPLNAPTRDGIEKNKDYARQCVRDSLMRGEAPFASHLLYDQAHILNDLVVSERTLGMNAGFAWMLQADLVAVYTDLGISAGMKHGIFTADENGIPVEYRRLKNDGKR